MPLSTGVVPISFGSDALGGAIDLVTNRNVMTGVGGNVSYQGGSFGTHRVTADTHFLGAASGRFVRLAGFFDTTQNNYPIDVEIDDSRGQPLPATVDRFHDAYRAGGVTLEAGFLNRSWAESALVQIYHAQSFNEVQNNPVMTVPYGEPENRLSRTGANIVFRNTFNEVFSVQTILGFSRSTNLFQDLGECAYNWLGGCTAPLRTPGEIERNVPRDTKLVDDAFFMRTSLQYKLGNLDALTLSVAPTVESRSGDNLLITAEDAFDPLTAQRDLTSVINGLSYRTSRIDEKFKLTLFFKHYGQALRSEEPVPGGLLRDADRGTNRFGGGIETRMAWTPWFSTKASFEHNATRLPRVEEVFGNGVFIVDNLELVPEVSQNANLTLNFSANKTLVGTLNLEIHGFWREVSDLILLLGTTEIQSYQNVWDATSMGTEVGGSWVTPGDYFSVNLNATYMDFQNTSEEGPFGRFSGDRIPNRPYAFANASARVALPGVFKTDDNLSFVWYSRYVHDFFRTWESLGLRQFKDTIDSQLTHSLGLTYRVSDKRDLSFTGEIQNLTDAKVFDLFGVQRPGRAAFFKVVAGI